MQTQNYNMNVAVPTNTVVDTLDGFLKLELAAAATYEQALNHIDDPATRTTLTRSRTSHASRAAVLSQHIKQHGGKPSSSAGPLSFFTKLVEGGASLLGRNAVLGALHEGEEYVLRRLLADIPRVDSPVYRELWANVLSEQHECERRLRVLMS